MESNEHALPINELPLETLMEIFEHFSISEIAQFPRTCTHWRDLMKQDHFWASLARKTYGQYVGEIPKRRELEELSKRCNQELTFVHWLQYRSLFGLTMNMAVHVGVFMPDDAFDYKVTLEPGLNTRLHSHWSVEKIYFGLSATSWRSTIFIVITPQRGDPIRKEIPLITLQEMTSRQQFRHDGKTFKFKLQLTKMLHHFLDSASRRYFYPGQEFAEGSEEHELLYLNKQMQGQFRLTTAVDVLTPFRMTFNGTTERYHMALVGLKPQQFKTVFRQKNPFIYPPTCTHPHTQYVQPFMHFIYHDLKLHEYIPILAKNFNEAIKSQMQLYLAEIVCGFEFLHLHNIYLKDCIPIIKKDGHLQLVYAGFRDLMKYSYFGLEAVDYDALANTKRKQTPFQTDCYALGVFLLEVCTGQVLSKRFDYSTYAEVPHGLSVELTDLLSTLLAKIGLERPKNIVLIKKSAYFKGIDWHKMRRQDWSPKFLPNLE